MTTSDKHIDSKFSKDWAYPTEGVRPIDLYYDKQFYGRVDESQNAVYIPDFSMLGQLIAPSSTTPLFALDFVAKAFNDLRRHYSKAVAFGRVGESTYLNKLEAKKGLVDPNIEYRNYLDVYFSSFHSQLIRTKKEQNVVKFGDYVAEFIAYVMERTAEFPFTRTKFIKSNNSSIATTGLAIQVSLLKPSLVNKDAWIEDSNFDFYRNAAALFGFMVDENRPWTLIADVSSLEMQQHWVDVQEPTAEDIYLGRAQGLSDKEIITALRIETPINGLKYDPGSSSNLFERYYVKSHLVDADEIRDNLVRYYNEFVGSFPDRVMSVEKKCEAFSASTLPTRVEKIRTPRLEANAQEIKDQSSMAYWMELCFLIRLGEEKLFLNKSKYNALMKNANQLLKKKLDKNSAMSYLNKQIIKIKSNERDRQCQNYESCIDSTQRGIEMTQTTAGLIPNTAKTLL